MRLVKPLLAVMSVALSAGAAAAPITDVFTVTLQNSQGIYSAGHVFDVTVQYDDASTVAHWWNDGANGIGEFGGGDDTTFITYNLADYAVYGFDLFTDAQISIAGLLPVAWPSWDVNSASTSRIIKSGDLSAGGFIEVTHVKDDLYFDLLIGGPAFEWNALTFAQYYISPEQPESWYAQFFADQAGFEYESNVSVPEPSTLALLGLGLACVGLGRRRRLN